MTIPNLNIEEVAKNCTGVYTALLAAASLLGEATIVFFLELVPEREDKLWDRFRNFQCQEGNSALNFVDFVKDVIKANVLKMFYPKECMLDVGTRKLLAMLISKEIMEACNIKSDNDILQIYFGEGKVYDVARKVSCKGCPKFGCNHNLDSRSRKK